MKTLPRIIFALSLLSTSYANSIEPFQLKGLRLGQSSEIACGNSVITTRLDDLIAKYKASAPDLIPMNVSECHIEADTFGGLEIDKGIDLLFLSGNLIQVKFELAPMHWLKYAEIFSPLEQMYGKPTITKNEPFTTHTWKQEESTLSTSRADNSSGIASLEIILRDEHSFKTYEERSEINREILGRLESKKTRADIRN